MVLAVACGDASTEQSGLFGTTDGGLVTRQQAEELGLSLLGGRVLASEQDEENGVEVFEIDVLRASGSVVEITVEVESGLVIEVDSDSPAPGDDLDVGEGLLTLLEAIDIATLEQPGTVVGWEIERDGAGAWTWEIEIETERDDEVEIEIDAATGAVDVDDAQGPWDDDDIDDDDIDDEYEGELPTPIADAALAIVSGTIEGWDRSTSDGFVRWEVDVRSSTGALVELELLGTSARLIEADGSDGPFDYAFEPPSYISLATAVSAAGLASAELAGWALDREDGRMVYELEAMDDDDDIYVDAVTGMVLADTDDEDDDAGS